MPFGDLFPRTVNDLVPLTTGRRVGFVRPISHLQTPDHFVAGDAVPVVNDKLKLDAPQVRATTGAGHRSTAGWRQVKHEGLVERWIQRFLLHLGFLLPDALSIVKQLYLDVRICTAAIFSLFIIVKIKIPIFIV